MAVLVVGITTDIEFCHLRTALTAHRLSLTVLLRNQSLDAELTELEVCLDTEQGLTASNERRRQIHRDVTRLDRLDDIVLFAFVIEFEVLLVKGERRLRVVREVEVQF